jgi:adenylyltransferase/sulfurtransferase
LKERDDAPSTDTPTPAGRYSIVERVAALRSADYGLLAAKSVIVVGCGALGSAVAMHLVRGGVGRVRVVDRDVVDLRNLTHQVLYTECDATLARLKAETAAEHLRGLNAACVVEGVVADYAPGNALHLAEGADLIVDGADNLETKFLLNDVAVATGTPLVYAGCAGAEGSVLAIMPGVTHCLRCLWPTPGQTAARMTCETRGLLPGTAAAVAALQSTEALKLLLELGASALGGLLRIDIWDGVLRRVPLPAFRGGSRACPTCQDRTFDYLRGAHSTTAYELCGDDTVLLYTPGPTPDLERLRRRHNTNPSLRARQECVQVEIGGCRILVFSSGRTLIHGAGGVNRAKALYTQHVIG